MEVKIFCAVTPRVAQDGATPAWVAVNHGRHVVHLGRGGEGAVNHGRTVDTFTAAVWPQLWPALGRTLLWATSQQSSGEVCRRISSQLNSARPPRLLPGRGADGAPFRACVCPVQFSMSSTGASKQATGSAPSPDDARRPEPGSDGPIAAREIEFDFGSDGFMEQRVPETCGGAPGGAGLVIVHVPSIVRRSRRCDGRPAASSVGRRERTVFYLVGEAQCGGRGGAAAG